MFHIVYVTLCAHAYTYKHTVEAPLNTRIIKNHEFKIGSRD